MSEEYKIEIESFHKWKDEASPLFERHWQEIANYKDTVPLNVDYEYYLGKDADGSLLSITVRKDGALIGYAWFELKRLGHYKHVKCAHNDIIFIDKPHRGGIGTRLISECEKICYSLGIDKVLWHVKPQHNWSSILLRRGYIEEDIILGKMLR